MQVIATAKNYSIPLRHELLIETDYNYEEAIILNQLLYSHNNAPHRRLNIYDIKNVCCFSKSIKTLRKIMDRLVEKGLVTKRGNSLYNTYIFEINQEYFIESNELVSLIETKDLQYGDYYYAALTNYFRQQLHQNNSELEISAQQLKNTLRMDGKCVSSVRNRLEQLERNKVIKRKLNGRIYSYELYSETLLNRTPEELQQQANDLDTLLFKHCERFNYRNSASNHIVFSRMIDEGYSYDDLRRIIAYLGHAGEKVRRYYVSASNIRNSYVKLLEQSSTISRYKANMYLEKLIKNQLPRVTKTPSIISDNQVWQESADFLQKYEGVLVNKYMELSNAKRIMMEYDEFFNTVLLAVFTNAKKRQVSPFTLGNSYLNKLIMCRLANSHIGQASAYDLDIENEESHSSVAIPDDIDVPASLVDIKNIPVELSHIDVKDFQLFIDYYMKSVKGNRSQQTIADEYGYSVGKVNNILKYIKSEIKTHLGVDFFNISSDPPPSR